MIDRKQQTNDRQKRIDYLVKHWDAYKLDKYPWPLADKEAKQNKIMAIVNEMKNRGLISMKTNWFDVSFNTLVKDARKVRENDR